METTKNDQYVIEVHEHGVDRIRNHIYLNPVNYVEEENTGVDYNMAARFIKNINICRLTNPSLPIVIHMLTVGGDWTSGMAIYDAIKTCPIPTVILNYGESRSMSSIIMQAADKRVTMPNGLFMFHDGTVDFAGTVKQAESYMRMNEMAKETMISIYVESMRDAGFLKNDSLRRKWLIDRMNRLEDVYLTADEAIMCGFFHEKFNGEWDTLDIVLE